MDDKDTLRVATDCAFHEAGTDDTTTGGTDARFLTTEFDDDTLSADAAAHATDGLQDAEERLEAQVIEALLFASDAPLSAARIADLVDSATPAAVRRHIAALNDKYERAGLSFRIEAIARGYQMMTLPDFRPWLEKLNKQRREIRLSGAALETLSIIAYKQPIIRADVEAIRGVACGEVIARLRDMGLIRVLGRAEILGRPLLYGTTKKFLDVFGLPDLDDLPPMEALKLKPTSKPAEQVEPVKPAAIPAPPLEQRAAVG
jgi:segregation and condensation protein B